MKNSSTLAAATALSIVVLAAACSSGGGGSGGSPDGGGGSGGGGSDALAACKALCDSVVTACPDLGANTKEDCAKVCDHRFSHPRANGCQSELLAYYQCISKPNNIECFESYWEYADPCYALVAPLDECMKGEVICAVASQPPSGGSCYAGRGECNLMLDDCPSGKVCATEFGGATKCVDATSSTASEVCATCSDISMYCTKGSICHHEVAAGTYQCARYCCTDADCDGSPGSCWEYDAEYHIKMCYR